MNTGGEICGQMYRLIITRRNGTETLLLPCGRRWTLPSLEVESIRRLAEQLTAGVHKKWKVESCCVFAGNSPNAVEDAPTRNYAVMESLAHNDHAPPESFWMTSAAMIRKGVLPYQDHLIAREALRELHRYSVAADSAPLAKVGWLREMFSWAQQQIGPFGLRLTGTLRQFTAGPSSSLIRMETDGPAVWFKAAGEPRRRELEIAAMLDRLFPGYVPQIWGMHPFWNGWLAPEIPGSTLDAFSNTSAWATAARRLAELQIASLGKTSDLLQSGCADRRIGKLVEQIDSFVALMKELMAAQTKNHPAALKNSELDELRDELMGACAAMQTLDLPDALGHIDFNPGNILVSGSTCFFLDWAEGCVANPLITFEYLCEHLSRRGLDAPAAKERIISAYLEPWPPLLSSALLQGMTISPLLAAFAYATAGDSWNSPDAVQNTSLGGYLRSLTRRMRRESAGLYAKE